MQIRLLTYLLDLFKSFRRRFYGSDDPTNSVIALKDDGQSTRSRASLTRLRSVKGKEKDVSKTRGQSNLTKSASRGAHSPVRGHPRGSKFVPLNSWGRGSY